MVRAPRINMTNLDPNFIRHKTIELSCNSGAGHLAPSLSCVEILSVLFKDFLSYNINNAHDDTRDRLVFSKGHGAYAYYVILNQLGFLPNDELENYYTPQASIKGCLTENSDYMIEASTGSLGHGLPIAVGMAKAFKMQGLSNKVVCIVGDGEMQEGSNFESLALAHQFKLNNLLIIIDANGLQAMDRVSDVGLSNPHLSRILSMYSDNFFDIDGHNITQLNNVYNSFFNASNDNFSLAVAHTIKGKGISLIEDSIAHHFRCPTQDGYVLEPLDE